MSLYIFDLEYSLHNWVNIVFRYLITWNNLLIWVDPQKSWKITNCHMKCSKKWLRTHLTTSPAAKSCILLKSFFLPVLQSGRIRSCRSPGSPDEDTCWIREHVRRKTCIIKKTLTPPWAPPSLVVSRQFFSFFIFYIFFSSVFLLQNVPLS